jgi:hypothetical protein
MRYLIVLLSFLLFQVYGNAQYVENDTLSAITPKKRFYLDLSAYSAWKGDLSNIGSGVFGVQMKFGNDFMLKPIHENLYVRLNWLRLGLILGDASGLILTPLHAGVGYQLKLSKNLTLEPKFTGGLYIGTDDILYPSLEFDYAVVPALSIVSKKSFSIEVEWIRRRNFLGPFSGSYLNLSFGSIIF